MSYINVRLFGGPADGKVVAVPLGVGEYRVAELPKMELYSPDRGNDPVSPLVRTHRYVINSDQCSGRYYEGILQA